MAAPGGGRPPEGEGRKQKEDGGGRTALGPPARWRRREERPTRPITLIVPFSAGGGIDMSARIQALRMGELLGQSIVVENVGAAAGMAGGQRVTQGAARRLHAADRQ